MSAYIFSNCITSRSPPSPPPPSPTSPVASIFSDPDTGPEFAATTHDTSHLLGHDDSCFNYHPADDDEWHACFLRPQQLVGGLQHILSLPPFHFVGKTDRGLYIVAAASSAVQKLKARVRLIPVVMDFAGAPWLPSPEERDMSNDDLALNRAYSQFVSNAAHGILKRNAAGLVRFYRDMLPSIDDWSPRLPIEWAILVLDIKDSDESVRESFFQWCCFLSLHRPEEEWLRIFGELTKEPWPTDTSAGKQKLALLRGVLKVAHGMDWVHDRWIEDEWPDSYTDDDYSANENLRLLCELFRVSDTQVDEKLAQVGCLDVNDLTRHVHIRHSSDVYDSMAAELVNNLPYKDVTETLINCQSTLHQCPSFNAPLEWTALFLCHYTDRYRHTNQGQHTSQCQHANRTVSWLTSQDGMQFRQSLEAKLVQALCSEDEPARTCSELALWFTALACFAKLSYQEDTLVAPRYGSYLQDWFAFVDDSSRMAANNNTAMWRHMVGFMPWRIPTFRILPRPQPGHLSDYETMRYYQLLEDGKNHHMARGRVEHEFQKLQNGRVARRMDVLGADEAESRQ